VILWAAIKATLPESEQKHEAMASNCCFDSEILCTLIIISITYYESR